MTMTTGAIELEVGEVSNMEARVYARYRAAGGGGPELAAPVVVRGTLRGPYCERARTLPAEYPFHDFGSAAAAEAVVPDPCLWSVELPHVYRAEVEARAGGQVVAEFRGAIALRVSGRMP
jgi:Glycosyl hydrolases family 2